jgi:prepilin peptidase CpaA
MSDDLFANLLLLGLAGLLVWAAVGDIRTFNIPNELNAAIALGAPLFWWAADIPVWPDGALRVGVALIVFAVLAGAFWLGMMGGGDVKMAAAVLLWFPVEVTLRLSDDHVAGGRRGHAGGADPPPGGRREGRPEVPYGVAISFAGLWLITPTISLPF